MHKALGPRDDVDWLYVSRKKGGRRLISIEDSADASIQQLEDYIEKRGRRLFTATRNNTDYTRTNVNNPENKNGKKNISMDFLSN